MNGIKFDDVHSYADLNLVLAPFDIPSAKPKEKYLDIPGGDGSLDLTESLGEVKFQDRKAKFTFTVFPSDDFEIKKTKVSNFLNGRRFKIRVDKDPDYYWEGRCAVDDYASNKSVHQIVVVATLAPYKLKNSLTEVDVSAGTDIPVVLENARKTAIPAITVEADTIISFGGKTISLTAGTHKVLDLVLVEGKNHVTVTSTKDVKFTYQEGDL